MSTASRSTIDRVVVNRAAAEFQQPEGHPLVSVYQPQLSPRNLRRSADAVGVIRGQMATMQTGSAEGEYGLYREQLMNQ